MNTPPQRAHDGLTALERAVLQALAAHRGAVPQEAWRLLAAYRFFLPLHQVVFEVLREPGPTRSPDVRASLIERLTRRGFPDVDVDQFFVSVPSGPEDLVSLVRELCEMAGLREPSTGS